MLRIDRYGGIVVSIFLLILAQAHGDHGILEIETGEDSGLSFTDSAFCFVYFPDLYDSFESRELAPRWDVADIMDLDTVNPCDDGDDLSVLGLAGHFPIFPSNLTLANCSLAEKMTNLQKYDVLGFLSNGFAGSRFNDSLFNISKPYGALKDKTSRERILELQEKYSSAKFLMYRPKEKNFDLSLVVILSLAVLTIMLGSLWSGYTKHSLRLRKQSDAGASGERRRVLEGVAGERSSSRERGRGEEEEELSVHVTPVLVMFFVFCMCSMLVLLYFFFDQLVYIIMGMFCVASSLAMYSCLEPLVFMSYTIPWLPVLRFPRMNLFLCILNLELRQLLLLTLSVSTSVVWFVYRKTTWSWIVQDFLGVMFSLNMMRVIRMPSLKICTVLLSALFFYDIFFVFITPLFMKDGKSVMVEVATGHSSDEQLPMVLRVPHFSSDPCYGDTLLGFGDILVPGLLLSFCHGYDLLVKTPCKLYWVLTSVAYILGLVATFVSLLLMNSAQPALLYLVPFTLVPTILVAWIRGDLAAMWQGDIPVEEKEDYENVESEEEGEGEEEEEEDNHTRNQDGSNPNRN